MTRDEAMPQVIQMIAEAFEFLAKTGGFSRGLASYRRQAEYLLALAEMQDEWNAHRGGRPMLEPGPDDPARFRAYHIIKMLKTGPEKIRRRKMRDWID